MIRIRVYKKAALVLFGLLGFVYLLSFSGRHRYSDEFRSAVIVPDSEEDEVETGEVLACQRAQLKLHSPEVDRFFYHVPKVECGPKDWVRVQGSVAVIKEEVLEKYESVNCRFTELLRQDDDTTVLGKTTVVNDREKYVFVKSDYVEVDCQSLMGFKWKSYLAAPRKGLQVLKTSEDGAQSPRPLDVLIWGQDSLSRLTFIRKLPKAWKYLKTLDPVVLKGYNIIGDGTPQALIPMLTGKTEVELPEARSEKGVLANYLDVYPWIWNEYKERGYLTGFLEDQPTTATFNHRHKGFRKAPTDLYMRTFFLAVDKFLYPVLTKVFSYIKPSFCLAGTPMHRVMMDYFTNIATAYGGTPKFLFSFRSEQSHNDLNAIQGADEDLAEFFRDLKDGGVLDKAVFVVMSDHGSRFQSIRESMQGKLEERLPMFLFVFPSWFKKSYPMAYSNFKNNSNKLVTPFDVHRTLQDILKLGRGLEDRDFGVFEKGTQSRALSLFRRVPASRTCDDAEVEAHWCTCLKEEKLEVDDPIVIKAAQVFVESVNRWTLKHRNLCAPLELRRVAWASKLVPSEAVLRFRYSSDRDGRVPDMKGKTEVSQSVMQLKVETEPGGGHFEVTMTFERESGELVVKERDISRTNKYGSQADCVDGNVATAYLRKYCFCIR